MASGKPQLAFAGLGAMGGGMAKNLVKNGFTVTGFDVYQPLVDSFVEAGGKAAKTPKEAAAAADMMVSMVANAAQNSALLFEGDDAAIHGLKKGATFILCSTCPPAFSLEVRHRLDQVGRADIKFLDCPVSGGTIRAANGTLSIFSSGPDADLESANDVLDCMSGNLYKIEGGISGGTKTKTIHQLLAATNIITASEAMGLAATVGLNTTAVMEHVNKSDGASFMFENRAPHMLKNDWHPYSALAIILKDAGIVTDTARKTQFPTPMADCAEQLYLEGVQQGMLRDDDAKLVQMYLPKDKLDLTAVKATADTKMVSSHKVNNETIADMMAGIHLAASVEGMRFCKHLGMSTKLMYEIISKAAGWNAMFDKCIPGMLEKDSWSLAACREAHEVREKLAHAVDRCQAIKYPCPMAATALQQFNFATLRQ